MNFVFASSHLPEDNRPQADEEDEEDVQPMQRSGMVRAFSHLPQPVQGAPAAPRPSVPAHLPSRATEPPETEPKPEAETDAGSHGDFEPPATTGSDTHGTIGPVSPRGATPPASRSLFLTPRPMPPEYARQQATTYGAAPNNRGNASNLGSSTQLPARTDALAQAGGQQPGPATVQPRDSSETPKQPSPAVPVPSPANPAPQQPSQSGTDPLTKLKEHVAKSRNPISSKTTMMKKHPLRKNFCSSNSFCP
jgi:hypothetical protein